MKDTRDRRDYFRAKRADPDFIEKEKQRARLRATAPDYAEKERIRSAKRRAANRQHLNEIARARHKERMAREAAYKEGKARTALNWSRSNSDKRASRRVRMPGVTPAWAHRYSIQETYEIAAAYRINFGMEAEVDHIVPLISPIVCGLHTPANLRIITPFENRSKGNRHWPDMP